MRIQSMPTPNKRCMNRECENMWDWDMGFHTTRSSLSDWQQHRSQTPSLQPVLLASLKHRFGAAPRGAGSTLLAAPAVGPPSQESPLASLT